MVFSAVYVCSECGLRFAQRRRCICGNPKLLSLRTEAGKRWYQRAAHGVVAATAIDWVYDRARRAAPLVSWPFYLFSVAWTLTLVVPTLRQGGAFSGEHVGGLAFVALLTLYVAFTSHAKRSPRSRERVRLRIHETTTPLGRVVLRGVARRATAELVAPLSGAPCLAFGVRGDVGRIEVDDAEGGDFDLELPSGERIAVSLEHAILQPSADALDAAPDRIDAALGSLLESRGIDPSGQRVALAETLVRDGDAIEIEGDIEDGALVAVGYRSAKAVRVVAGAADAPLVVRPR